MSKTLELTPAQAMAVDSIDYAGNLRFTRLQNSSSSDAFILDYFFDGGFLSFTPATGSQIGYDKALYFFVRDHQGNNRVVVDSSDNIKQINHYYPYGGPWYYFSTNQGFQPYKYNGKEFDRTHGLDWYDYGARRYDPAFAQFTQMDPLAEKYPHLSPYAYCAGNPVRYVDPDGRHVRVRRNEDGSYQVVDGGTVDGDLNVYDVTDGWENRVSIGEALTQFSFMDDNGKPVTESIINLNDQSGQEFWNNFVNNIPSIFSYMFNATEKKKYDFKQQDAPDPKLVPHDKYNNRGMIVSINGHKYIASARDIGNYTAGYIAGHNGLSWMETRLGFDALETYQHHFSPSIEGKTSQYAQFKGYMQGLKHISLTKALKLRLIEFKVLKNLYP